MSRRIRRVFVALISVLLLTAALSSTALADQRNFNLNNNSDYLIAHAYVSASVDPEWGDDILGKEFMSPGESWAIGFDRGNPDTCIWDLKLVTVGGIEVKVPELNLCELTDFNINN